jgi:mRNA interferase RelE/StbE
MYQAVVERSAEKDLRRLGPNVRPRVITAVTALTKNPRPGGSRKLAGTKHDWRIRVGDYRITYEIADEIRVLRINRIRHRREAYR